MKGMYKMRIYPITQNYSQNYNRNNQNQSVQSSVAFTGIRGDKIVSDLAKFEDVKLADVMKDLKGAFGLKTDKVEDVIESLLAAVKAGFNKEAVTAEELKVTKSSLERAEQKAKDAQEDIADLKEVFSGTIKAKTVALKEKEAELKKAQEFADKFKPMSTVKSVDELGAIMPNEAIKVANEFKESKSKAAQSMMDFLLTGKGQEEFLSQLERNNIISKARRDGLADIPEVDEALKHVYTDISHNFILDVIKNSLKTCSKGDYVLSNAMSEQIKKNAAAILLPNVDERYIPRISGLKPDVPKFVDGKVAEVIKEVQEFYRSLKPAKEKFLRSIEKNSEIEKTEFVSVPGIPYRTGYVITYKDASIKAHFQSLDNIIESNRYGWYN